jgi:hypothetical protein
MAYSATQAPFYAWDKRWENLKGGIPVLKFKSNNMEKLNTYYVSLQELLENETHPFKLEFRPALLPLEEIKKALKKLLLKR